VNDPELPYAIAFLIFGIAFFLLVMILIFVDYHRKEDRKDSRAREFGFEGSMLQKEAESYKPK